MSLRDGLWTWPGTISRKLPVGVESYPTLGLKAVNLGWSAFPCWVGTHPKMGEQVKLPAIKEHTGFYDNWITPENFSKIVSGLRNVDTKFFNTGLRFPRYVIANDVDVYGPKPGDDTMIEIFEGWPALFDGTLRIGARGIETRSACYLFRSSHPGWQILGNLGNASGVDVVKWSHRHVMMPGSFHHKTWQLYRAYVGDVEVEMVGPDSPVILDMPDDVADRIITYGIEHKGAQTTRGGRRRTIRLEDRVQLEDFRFLPDVALCDGMRWAVERAVEQLAPAESFHDVMHRSVGLLFGRAEHGHCGLRPALELVEALFNDKVINRTGNGGGSAVGDVVRSASWVMTEIGPGVELGHEFCRSCEDVRFMFGDDNG